MHRATNKSLMAGSSKGLMAARPLPGRQPHSFPERHSFCQSRCLSSPRSFVHFLKEEASPGEARRQKDGCVSCSFAFSRTGPGLLVLWLIFCRIWVCSSAFFTRLGWGGRGRTVQLAVPPPMAVLFLPVPMDLGTSREEK